MRELENIILNAVARTLDDDYIKSVDLPEEYLKIREHKSHKAKLISISDAEEAYNKCDEICGQQCAASSTSFRCK